MQRLFGIGFGVATQVLFVGTVPILYRFLAGHEPAPAAACEWGNALLALQFAIPHSLLLNSAVQRRLRPWVPTPFFGGFFCVVTCVSLLVTIAFWQESPILVFRLEGLAGLFVRGLFLASWVALVYSLSLGSLGYQTGLIPWWDWVCRRPPRKRAFVQHGAYRFLRHPIYLSFLGLIWFTPVMTLDRLVLIAVWTPYVFLGSCWKDRRLTFFLHDVYREYMSRVPGYPGVPVGPLAKVPFAPEPIDVIPFSRPDVPRTSEAVPARVA